MKRNTFLFLLLGAALSFSVSACKGDKASDGVVDEAALDAAETISMADLNREQFQENSVGAALKEALAGDRDLTNQLFLFNYVTFDSSRAVLNEYGVDPTPGVTEVDNLALIMKAYPKLEVRLAVSSVATGDADADKRITQMRGMAIKNRLIEKGIKPMRVELNPIVVEGEGNSGDRIGLTVLRKE